MRMQDRIDPPYTHTHKQTHAKENGWGRAVPEKMWIFRNFIFGVKKGEKGKKGARCGSTTTILFSWLHHTPQHSYAKGKWLETCRFREEWIIRNLIFGVKMEKRGKKGARCGSISLISFSWLHCPPPHTHTLKQKKMAGDIKFRRKSGSSTI